MDTTIILKCCCPTFEIKGSITCKPTATYNILLHIVNNLEMDQTCLQVCSAALRATVPSLFPFLLLLVVDASESSDGGGQATGQRFGRLSVVLWFGPQQGDDVLQGAGGLQAQSIHHIAQIVDIRGQLFG